MRRRHAQAFAISHPLADGINIMASGGFFPETEPLSRSGCPSGTVRAAQRSLVRPETPVTKSASAAATLSAPPPSLFSDSGTLAQDLVEAYLAVRGETERRAAPLSAEDQVVQSMP